jgi:hypothetical protein
LVLPLTRLRRQKEAILTLTLTRLVDVQQANLWPTACLAWHENEMREQKINVNSSSANLASALNEY